MNKYIWLLCSISMIGLAESEKLTLDRALDLARQNSPRLRAAEKQIEAAKQAAAAAGLWKSPELEFEAEGVGGDNRGFDSTEYTVGLKQEFPLGGKGPKERAVAQQTVAAFSQASRQEVLELEEDVRRVFIELMTQQEIVKVRSEQEQLGRAFVEVAQRRLEAGGGSELEVVQAELALAEIRLAQTCCFGDLKAEQEKLASLLNMPFEDLPEATGAYYELDSVDALTLDDNFPALRKLAAEEEMLRAQALRDRAGDIPDVTLGAGVRHDSGSKIDTFLFSASIPLTFNRRGRTQSAAGLLRAEAVLAKREETRRALERELKSLKALYEGIRAQVELSKKELIPKAEQAYELSRKGYETGRFSWLELIAAQQNLAEIRINHIETLREAHLIRAELSKFMKEGMDR
jgi:cobalt-zinc-cadmium efflux system outer membrane protein